MAWSLGVPWPVVGVRSPGFAKIIVVGYYFVCFAVVSMEAPVGGHEQRIAQNTGGHPCMYDA